MSYHVRSARMMKMFVIGLFLSLVANSGSLASGEPAKTIVKSYGPLKPVETEAVCSFDFSRANVYQTYGLVSQCSINYKGEVDKQTYDWPVVRLTVLDHVTGEIAKDDLLHRVLEHYQSELNDKFKGSPPLKEFIVTNNRRDTTAVYWLSGKKVVSILAMDTPVPDDLLRDYQALYPPEAVDPAELDVEKILRKGLRQKWAIINEKENGRTGTRALADKPEAFRAIMVQCKVEMDMRCQVGLTAPDKTVSCPAALLEDDADRASEWKELEATVNARKIILTNVNWDDPAVGTCPRADKGIEKTVVDILQMKPEEMREIFK